MQGTSFLPWLIMFERESERNCMNKERWWSIHCTAGPFIERNIVPHDNHIHINLLSVFLNFCVCFSLKYLTFLWCGRPVSPISDDGNIRKLRKFLLSLSIYHNFLPKATWKHSFLLVANDDFFDQYIPRWSFVRNDFPHCVQPSHRVHQNTQKHTRLQTWQHSNHYNTFCWRLQPHLKQQCQTQEARCWHWKQGHLYGPLFQAKQMPITFSCVGEADQHSILSFHTDSN